MPKGFWSVWATALLYFAAFYTLLVPLPLYLGQIGLPDWEIGAILGAFGVAALIGRPLAGALADRWGCRPIVMFGAGALAVGAAGTALTIQPALLFGCRLLQAAGYTAFTTAATALIANLATSQRRGSALAFYGISINLAMALVPVAIDAVLKSLTLAGAFWLSGILALATGVYAWAALSRSVEPRPTQAIEWRNLWRIPPELRVPMTIAVFFGVGYGAFLQFLPLLAERRHLGSPGLAYGVYGVSIVLTRILTGRLIDRPRRDSIMLLAVFGLTLGLVWLAAARSTAEMLAAAALTAAAAGILHPALIARHVELAPGGQTGRATGIFYLGFDFGIGAGAWALAPALQWLDLGGLYGMAAVTVLASALLVSRMHQSSNFTEKSTTR
ncbi:MAG TPA: MFS transporter [Opitutaceae bacterium]|nr:MFS transporter [Opitutaceae bacterium]